MTTFEADLEAVLADMVDARAELVSVVQALGEPDLERLKRGGWPISRILEHVIDHDYLLSKMAATIRKTGSPDRIEVSCAGQSIDEILCHLESGRKLLLAAVEGVVEDDFYRLEKVGYEEYSVISLLENTASHDREHTHQIRSILKATA